MITILLKNCTDIHVHVKAFFGKILLFFMQIAVQSVHIISIHDLLLKKCCHILKFSNRPFYSCMLLVTWLLNSSEAGGDLVLIQTSLLLLCKSCYSYANYLVFT